MKQLSLYLVLCSILFLTACEGKSLKGDITPQTPSPTTPVSNTAPLKCPEGKPVEVWNTNKQIMETVCKPCNYAVPLNQEWVWDEIAMGCSLKSKTCSDLLPRYRLLEALQKPESDLINKRAELVRIFYLWKKEHPTPYKTEAEIAYADTMERNINKLGEDLHTLQADKERIKEMSELARDLDTMWIERICLKK